MAIQKTYPSPTGANIANTYYVLSEVRLILSTGALVGLVGAYNTQADYAASKPPFDQWLLDFNPTEAATIYDRNSAAVQTLIGKVYTAAKAKYASIVGGGTDV